MEQLEQTQQASPSTCDCTVDVFFFFFFATVFLSLLQIDIFVQQSRL